MSSAFLYVAIVAIWAVFLVPAWLRRPQGQRHRRDSGDRSGASADAAGASVADAIGEDSADLAGGQSAGAWREPPVIAGPAHRHESGSGLRSTRADPEPTARGDALEPSAPESDRIPAAGGRDKMLSARRRMLLTLIMLTVAAVGAAAAGFAGLWICIPPAGMLAFYLLLLREVAIADAEIGRSMQADRLAHAVRERAMREHPSWQSREAVQQTATIIDISGRVGDQLYDQYADAAARAVGD